MPGHNQSQVELNKLQQENLQYFAEMQAEAQRSEHKWWCSVVPLAHYTVLGLISMSTATLVAGDPKWSSVGLIVLFIVILQEWFHVYDASFGAVPTSKNYALKPVAFGALSWIIFEMIVTLVTGIQLNKECLSLLMGGSK